MHPRSTSSPASIVRAWHPTGGRPRLTAILTLAILAFVAATRVCAEEFQGFVYRTSIGKIVIYGYTGSGGDVVIPDTLGGQPVRTIAAEAFRENGSLTGIRIPESVDTIDDGSFRDCPRLMRIDVHPDNPAYRSEDGVLFERASDALVGYPAGKTGDYAVPAGVVSLSHNSFYGCTGLSGISLPDSLVSIGRAAFFGCRGLTKINLPDSVNTIGISGFSGCTGLTEVALPENVTSVGTNLFFGCVRLSSVTLGSQVTRIGSGAFQGCKSLRQIRIPAAVTSIEPDVFVDCSALTAIEVAEGNDYYREDGGVLLDWREKSVLLCPRSRSGTYATPSGIARISPLAFSQCTGLTGVTIRHGVLTIGRSAFAGCVRLEAVSLPDTVRDIESGAFAGCSGLAALTLGKNVRNIGASAFQGCTGLTAVTIPAAVTDIGWAAFLGCTGLTGIEVETGNTAFLRAGGVVFTHDRLRLVQYPGAMTGHYRIPDGVRSIAGAFIGSGGLTGVTIPASIGFMQDSEFSACPALTRIDVEDGNPEFRSVDGVLLSADGSNLLRVPAARTGEFVISEGVSSARDGVFDGCAHLTGLTIPVGMSFLGYSALVDCTGLLEIEVEAGHSVMRSVGGVLFSADRTELIRFPAGRGGEYSIPSSVVSVRHSAFDGAAALTRISVPAGVESTGFFVGCTALLRIEVARANRYYKSGDGVLFDVEREHLLRYPAGRPGSFAIPAGVTSLSENAFADSAGLTEITIPAGVTSIGTTAFARCPALDSAIFEGNAPDAFGDSVFDGASESFTIWFQETSVGFSSPEWQGYRAMLAGSADLEFVVESISRENGQVIVRAGPGLQGWSYELQVSPDLGLTPWTSAASTTQVSPDGTVEFSAPSSPASRVYYRVTGRGP